ARLHARPGDLVHVQLAGDVPELLVEEHLRGVGGLGRVQVRGREGLHLQAGEHLEVGQVRPFRGDQVGLGDRVAGVGLVRIALTVVYREVEPVPVETGLGAIVMRGDGELRPFPRSGGVGGGGYGEIAVHRVDALDPGDPAAGERVVQDAG